MMKISCKFKKNKTHLANLNYENRNDIALTNVYTNYADIKKFDSIVQKYSKRKQ